MIIKWWATQLETVLCALSSFYMNLYVHVVEFIQSFLMPSHTCGKIVH